MHSSQYLQWKKCRVFRETLACDGLPHTVFWFLRSPYQIEFTTHIGWLLVFMLCDFTGFTSQAVTSQIRVARLAGFMVNKKEKLAFHFIISEGVGTMKGCGRLDPFSVITYHLGLFFSPFSLAASSKRTGTLEGEASSELNIDNS